MKIPKFDYWKVGEEYKLDNYSIIIHTCCECQLRHIFFLEIKKDKIGSYISIRSFPDFEGTKALKFISKIRKRGEKNESKN